MNDFSQNEEDKSLLRNIFINILIFIFILMCYISLSAFFGSISTPFIENDGFFLGFRVVLFIFTFFVVIAGPLHGFFSGFISELSYQLTVYNEIYLDWCLIIGIFGFVSGIYKYRANMRIMYTFTILLISTFTTTFVIVISQIIQNQASLDINLIFINYGLNFLIDATISILILVPLLIFLFDKIFGSKERELYYLPLTHHPISEKDHTFYFQFGRTKIYFCSRCSGLIIGALTTIFFISLFESIFHFKLSPELALLLLIIFPIPAEIDWITQKLTKRKSSTASRILTGYMLGSGLIFVRLSQQYFTIGLVFVALYFGLVFLIKYIVHRKQSKNIVENII